MKFSHYAGNGQNDPFWGTPPLPPPGGGGYPPPPPLGGWGYPPSPAGRGGFAPEKGLFGSKMGLLRSISSQNSYFTPEKRDFPSQRGGVPPPSRGGPSKIGKTPKTQKRCYSIIAIFRFIKKTGVSIRFSTSKKGATL